MNMAASILGLGNAATPLGLRAMKDLETLNPRPGTATNAMCTYLAINTSSIQLIPATAIAILAANRSANPTAIVGTSIMATTCAAMAAVTAAKLLQRLPMYRLPRVVSPDPKAVVEGGTAAQSGGTGATGLRSPALSSKGGPGDAAKRFDKPIDSRIVEPRGEAQAAIENADKPIIREAATLQPLAWWGAAIMAAFGAFFVYVFFRLAFPEAVRQTLGSLLPALAPPVAATTAASSIFVRVVDAVSKLAIPFMLSVFPLYAALRRVKVYEEFVDGAREGFEVAIRIIPYLVAILVAMGMFRAAGGIDLLSNVLAPVMRAIGFPPPLLPMVLMRPLSGSGTLGLFAELVKQYGPDNIISRMGGTIFGSTETTFYVLAVYFGSVAVKRTRYALPAGLIADTVGVIASVIFCRLVFG